MAKTYICIIRSSFERLVGFCCLLSPHLSIQSSTIITMISTQTLIFLSRFLCYLSIRVDRFCLLQNPYHVLLE